MRSVLAVLLIPIGILGFLLITLGRFLLSAALGLVIVLRAVYGVMYGLASFLAGGFLLLAPGWRSGSRGTGLRLLVYIFQYLAFWTAVWWLQWRVLDEVWSDSTTWLIGSTAGLQTALQVLPAAVVAILVLVLGSLFGVAQLAITNYGARAPVMLTFDSQVQGAVIRPLLLTAAALLLAGQVPDQGLPDGAITAAVTTTALASVVMLAQAAALVPTFLLRYTIPRGFAQFVIAGVAEELEDGSTGYVVMRIGLLGEMLKQALKRNDSVAVAVTLEAFADFQLAYLAALGKAPGIRAHPLEDGTKRWHWLGQDTAPALVAAGEESLKLYSPEEDSDRIANVLEGITRRFQEVGETGDTIPCIHGLIEMATTAHQITPGGANFYAQPVLGLAHVEAGSEEFDDGQAPFVLAGWALAVAYPGYHFPGGFPTGQHPLFGPSVANFGPNPPWDDARGVVASDEWARIWANKQYVGPDPVLQALDDAEQLHGQLP